MKFLFRPLWLAVPDWLYFVLLFGGLIAMLVSIGMIIRGMMRKKDKFKLRGWVIAVLISAILIVLTMTGKIAPYCAFGGYNSNFSNRAVCEIYQA